MSSLICIYSFHMQERLIGFGVEINLEPMTQEYSLLIGARRV